MTLSYVFCRNSTKQPRCDVIEIVRNLSSGFGGLDGTISPFSLTA